MAQVGAECASQSDGEKQQQKRQEAKKIFVSFNYNILQIVTALKDRIEKDIGKDICWICTEDIDAGDSLCAEIAQGIQDADVILCMVTKDFVNSTMCEKEVELSFTKKKHIIPILFEKMDLANLKKQNGVTSPMELALAPLLYINMYDKSKEKSEFQKLITTLQKQLLKLRGAAGDCGDGQSNAANDEGAAGDCGDGQSNAANDEGNGAQAPRSAQNSNNVYISGNNNQVITNCVFKQNIQMPK